MKKAPKRHGLPDVITTDGLRSHGTAMRELGNEEKRDVPQVDTRQFTDIRQCSA